MASEWTTATIGEVAEKVAMGPFGSSIKVETFVSAGIPVISGQHLHGFKLLDSGFNFVTPEHAERLRNANVQRGDVIFTHAGNIGQVAYIPQNSLYDRYVISQRQFYMRCDLARIIPEFVVYYFKTREGQHKLLANTSQTGVPSIAQPVSYLRTIEIPVPPLSEQQAIAHILGTLDDKIELNRRMNVTLEGIARALFKSWFVDFDPVCAKAADQQPPGLAPHIADLFPDEFVESELGEIPKGWEVKPVGEVVRVVGGATPSTKNPAYWDGGIHCFATPKDLSGLSSPMLLDTERRVTGAGLAEISSGLLPVGTLLLSSRAPVGYLAIAQVPVCVNQGFIAMICDGLASNYYMLSWTEMNMPEIKRRASGTTFAEISKTNFRPILALVPPQEAVTAFDTAVEPVYAKVRSNLEESRTLAALRDALLPKLISGELRVPDAERIVGRCV